ncbi:folliculin-interacting protein 1 isoform X2 [Phlebotomus papatasi]|uniref:folliculin-interacting protein 1 isoform X2 n=1 Tax=Phlebotomus papatasi TaxID=29031 RepID=UPI002483E1EC|nr:folliculin-interacting protein 1 isoform X2 [Phlebotomus papatasi]
MALFNKLFSKRKNIPVPPSPRNVSSDFPFSTDQVRVLLFRECETPRLLFDSDSIQHVDRPVRPSNPPGGTGRKCGVPLNGNIVEISDGIIYKKDQGSDCGSLAEMIFGTVAMAFRGTSLKVHWLQSPPRILCSQVFFTPLQLNNFLSTEHSDLNSGDTSSMNSVSLSFSLCVENAADYSNQMSPPLDVPPAAEDNRLYGTYSACDSGYSGTDPWNTSVSSYCPMSSTRSSFGSVYSDQEGTSLRKLSIDSSIVDGGYSNGVTKSSDGSLQRRILRNISTSFENRQSMSDFIGYIGDNYPATMGGGSDGCMGSRLRRNSEIVENRSKPEMVRRKTTSGDGIAAHIPHHLQRQSARKARLGLAVCIKLSDSVENDMRTFCSEHIVLFESMLCRLRATAEAAYNNRQNFFPTMVRAWHTTSQWINDLFTAPRLMNPVWLTLSNGNSNKPSKLAHFFMDELCCLLTSADTKDTNFFISTLLTAILTHHLGWVGTVAPLSMPLPSSLDADAVKTQERAKMSEISRRHPYNALWAQLGDLFGAIGSPPKISKTIVSGNSSQMVDKVLNVLTYFIRCGEIQREMCEPMMVKESVDSVMENLECHTVTPQELDGRDESSWRRFEALRELSRSESVRSVVENKPKGGMSRSMTHVKDLSGLPRGGQESVGAINSHKMQDIERKNVMNDIPNVLVYRDSRFVKQELRIGNHLMDTGIEMNPKFKNDVRPYQVKSSREQIKFRISPESKEYNFLVAAEEKLARVDEIEEQQEISVECVSLGAIRKTSMSLSSFGVNGATGIEQGVEIGEDTIEDDRRYQGDGHPGTLTTCKSLSDLITENSFGHSGRLMWGVEPVKESLTIEEIKHRETRDKTPSDVVFVLGDNEELVGLKHSVSTSSVNGLKATDNEEPGAKKKVCNHKYKKHSGVKFNFEQYPQIAKTYMRNKNLDITDANFEKLLKMRDVKLMACGEAGTSSMGSLTEDENECECCLAGGATFLQTPSNASELEFSSEDNNYNTPPAQEVPLGGRKGKQEVEKGNPEETVKVVAIPMPQSQSVERDLGEKSTMPIAQSGFIPSLMTGISDHYISDMVLQGTVAPAKDFEGALRTDLTLASHSVTLEQLPTENVAIVANTDKWNVSVLSSHSTPGLSATNADHSVVMSPLVASMLETVQAMWRAGASPYQCMSFMESKLQEMYMQSETLAAFLLATDFCSMKSVTKALNLAADDVPLLMSVATVHSPQVAKKYGVSFRQ